MTHAHIPDPLRVPADCGPHTGDIVTRAVFAGRRLTPPDALAERTRLVWSSGDYQRIAAGFSGGAEEFVQRLSLTRGEAVLDVACGTGNLAIPAARTGARVTGLDIAPNLLEVARAAATARSLDIAFDDGDAEALPYDDATFTTTMSMFGVMFAPRPERALAELFRVTRAGGRIVMANWTPDGFVGQMLRAHTSLVPPPPGVPSVLGWGDTDQLHSRLGAHAARIRRVRFVPTLIEMAYPLTPGGVAELFREAYGPSVRTFAALDANGRAELAHELHRLWSQHDEGSNGTTRVRAEYLDVRIDVK